MTDSEWKNRLEVIPCGEAHDLYYKDEKSKKECVYSCPAPKGQYKHKRAAYFGRYANKKIDFIYEIDCVVVVTKDESENIQIDDSYGDYNYYNKDISKDQVLKRAREYFEEFIGRKDELDAWRQLFLLSSGEKADFIKESEGGLQSKKYFDIIKDLKINIKSSKELAEQLNGMKWQ